MEHVEANEPRFEIDVGVENASEEGYFGACERVVGGKKNVYNSFTGLIERIFGTLENQVELVGSVFVVVDFEV